jgi:ABC-type cobalamin/Fe3+-siderophores transport system ATPase subunit
MKFDCFISEYSVSGKKILSDIHFSIKAPSITVLLGRNGSGKTTLLRSILDGKGVPSGHYRLDEKDLSLCSVSERARYLSHLGSSDFTKPRLSVLEFLLICQGMNKDSAKLDLSMDVYFKQLDSWGLLHLKNVHASEISQGEFQRLLLCSVLNQEAGLYLLDEPETHLDPEGMCILKEMCQNKREEGKLVLIATHDIGTALGLGDMLIGLDQEGKQIFFSEREACIKSGEIEKLFGVSFSIYRDGNGIPQAVSASRKREEGRIFR